MNTLGIYSLWCFGFDWGREDAQQRFSVFVGTQSVRFFLGLILYTLCWTRWTILFPEQNFNFVFPPVFFFGWEISQALLLLLSKAHFPQQLLLSKLYFLMFGSGTLKIGVSAIWFFFEGILSFPRCQGQIHQKNCRALLPKDFTQNPEHFHVFFFNSCREWYWILPFAFLCSVICEQSICAPRMHQPFLSPHLCRYALAFPVSARRATNRRVYLVGFPPLFLYQLFMFCARASARPPPLSTQPFIDCVHLFPPVCQPARTLIHSSIIRSNHLSIHLPVCQPVRLSFCLSTLSWVYWLFNLSLPIHWPPFVSKMRP